jgi:hypothetical protein
MRPFGGKNNYVIIRVDINEFIIQGTKLKRPAKITIF